jgi:hypothetical protein
MELTEYEQKVITELWKDEIRRNVLQKALVIAATATPELTVGTLHTLFAGVSGQMSEEEEAREDKTS